VLEQSFVEAALELFRFLEDEYAFAAGYPESTEMGVYVPFYSDVLIASVSLERPGPVLDFSVETRSPRSQPYYLHRILNAMHAPEALTYRPSGAFHDDEALRREMISLAALVKSACHRLLAGDLSIFAPAASN
jgi:hypothetical protein